MFDTESWEQATVTHHQEWAPGLVTLTLDLVRDFLPGQFATVGLELDGQIVKRPLSLSSAPGAPLELFIVEVPDGALSPRLVALSPGETLWVRHKIVGTFTTAHVPESGALWLIGTGTGLAPYVSMIRHGDVLRHHDPVILVHGTRLQDDLAYGDELAAVPGLTYLPALTRAEAPLHGRLTTLFDDGSLERAAGHTIGPDTQVMLCGNPGMVMDMLERLRGRGLSLATPRRPGQVHLEKYW